MKKLANILGFQAIWWATALASAWAPWPALVLIALHLAWNRWSRSETLFVLSVGGLGVLMELVMTGAGVYRFNALGGVFLQALPLSIFTLWLAFACTLNHSLDWSLKSLRHTWWIGAFGGSTSYLAADKLGYLSLQMPLWQSMTWMAIAWGLLFVAFVFLQRFFFGAKEVIDGPQEGEVLPKTGHLI